MLFPKSWYFPQFLGRLAAGSDVPVGGGGGGGGGPRLAAASAASSRDLRSSNCALIFLKASESLARRSAMRSMIWMQVLARLSTSGFPNILNQPSEGDEQGIAGSILAN